MDFQRLRNQGRKNPKRESRLTRDFVRPRRKRHEEKPRDPDGTINQAGASAICKGGVRIKHVASLPNNAAVQRRRASAVRCNRLLAGLLAPSLARPCDYLTASALGSL
jgi:hypothetical protein